MNISDFENSIVDQFMLRLTNACDTKRRADAFKKVHTLLSQILDESVIITTFGSGPLKTYLPESDIDITILFTEAFS